MTERGAQRFFYRGETHVSPPGGVLVLHPDEVHDGGAGDANGLRYRMIYIPPERVGAATPGGGLPFIPTPILAAPRLRAVLRASFAAEDDDPLAAAGRLADVADALAAHAESPARAARIDDAGLRRAQATLDTRCIDGVSLAELEHVAGMDRFSLCRAFRRRFGVSPHRYLTLRRLDGVKRALLRGEPLAEAAVGNGFADQSHMTRRFKAAFGVTPQIWRNAAAPAAA